MPYKIYQHLPWVPWIPVDDDPPSRELVKTLIGTESLEAKSKPTAKKTLVYSKWGVGQLKKVGVESVYVPESVDTSVYIDRGKEESKKKLGFKPEHFVVGVVAANFGYPMRKAFDRMMIGFAKFAENHPNAVLYLHTNADESWRGHDAFDLIGLLKLISDEYPSLVGKVMFPDQYQLFRGISDEKMSEIYSAFDVLLASTGAEGFGLPILEAQSCSRPPIVTDFSSMPELADHGWKVKVKDKMLTGRMSYQVWPDEDDIAEILEYASRSDLKSRGEVCRDFALQFDNKVVADTYWKPLLTSLNV
jgi:glycosyltransferase involved in cell wall biosynthesis